MPEVDVLLVVASIIMSAIAIFISTMIALSNMKKADAERIAEETADIQRRLSRLEGRQEERDVKPNKGAV